MKAQLLFNDITYQVDFYQPLDISIPLVEGTQTVNCFYAPPFETAPVMAGDFVGSTQQGGPVNFRNIRLNPHGNGTHTETVGHISNEPISIYQSLTTFHFFAQVITLYPYKQPNGDRIILAEQIRQELKENINALIIRTMPNDDSKLNRNYSGTNPPYVHHHVMDELVHQNIQHFLIDLPSVDREMDGGKLLAHKAFWGYPKRVRRNSTITELIYVGNSIKDGLYLLNLQIASFTIDVSPSKPVLYKLTKVSND